jgi:hypothetical protein
MSVPVGHVSALALALMARHLIAIAAHPSHRSMRAAALHGLLKQPSCTAFPGINDASRRARHLRNSDSTM